MGKFNRRRFLQSSATAAVATGAFLSMPHVARAAGGKVVIVGGGAGGATAARYLKLFDPAMDVTLVEPLATYHTCFMSNEVIGGERDLKSIAVNYDGLKSLGINVVKDMAKSIDAAAKTVTIESGDTLAYDKCVVAPGISFDYGTTEGIGINDSDVIPHAWKAGGQTKILRNQLEAMPDGGTCCIVAPGNPFRCPPGPYERASMIAHYFKHHKPKSKVVIIDPKDKFSKQGLFMQAWKDLYGYGSPNSMIDWIPASKFGELVKVDAGTKTVVTDFETVKADVLNFIPPQKAGQIALAAGLANEAGWCPVDKRTFESTMHKDIYVIGDASIAAAMPKSGFAANSQGKVVAAHIIANLGGRESPVPSYVNTCYSIAGTDYGFSVAAVYRLSEDGKTISGVAGAGGLTPVDASAEIRRREVEFAHSWYNNIRQDIWGA
ncbi:MAG: FCSD flavin-binding domain-containing protein [Magnetospiraceae bacterium]